MLELVIRFFIVGAVAFGGGQAALPLLERLTVSDTGWLTPGDFATGVGLAYITPGPVLILAAFVGYRVAGVTGPLASTVAVFFAPVLLAGATARVVVLFRARPRFDAFGRFAGAAAIGLLGVTLITLAEPIVQEHAILGFCAAGVAFAARQGVPPWLLLGTGVIAGAVAAAILTMPSV